MSRAPVITLILSLPFLFLGLGWGLPNRATDRYLFGDRMPWTGAEVTALAGKWNPDGAVGADVQRDPLLDRGHANVINDTDAKRADLVRRYRLYTAQPDEMINLRAMSGMRPGRLELDPRLYQYGGLWFYPAGGLLKAASVLGFVTLTPDLNWYLDRPEAVGRLYLVLRFQTALWGLAGVVAMFWLARQFSARPFLAGMVGLAFATMPGVVVFSHEAKPHLPGVVLVLWAGVAGVRYARKVGSQSDWRALLPMCLAAGGAFGMVVSMLPAILVPLTAVWVRRERVGARMVGAVVLFAATYFVTNPYVLKHLLLSREMLFGQIGNSTAMYGVASGGAAVWSAISTAAFLLVMLTPAVLVVFVVAVVAVRETRYPLPLVMLAPVGLVSLGIFVALAAGKPGEYARFALLPAAFGVLAAGYLASRFRQQGPLMIVVIALHLGSVLLGFPDGKAILGAFLQDSGSDSPRLVDASVIAHLRPTRLTITAEPAPYNMPPVNLWDTELVLLPRGSAAQPTVLQPPKSDGYWKMSWAGRRVLVDRTRLSPEDSSK